MKIRNWFIFTEYETQAIPYILNLTGEDVNDDEINLCIHEQIYKQNIK